MVFCFFWRVVFFLFFYFHNDHIYGERLCHHHAAVPLQEYISKGINCQLCWDPQIYATKFGATEAAACGNMNPVNCFTNKYSMWEGFKDGCKDPVGKGFRDPVTPDELDGVEP